MVMSGKFVRTVVLDGSLFSSSLPRFDIVKRLTEYFDPQPVVSVQFMPGKRLRNTFLEASFKEKLEERESITVADVPLKIGGGGPRSQNVIVYQYPFEGHDSLVESYFKQFREVPSVSKQKYVDIHSVSTGAQIVKMTRTKATPRSADTGGYLC